MLSVLRPGPVVVAVVVAAGASGFAWRPLMGLTAVVAMVAQVDVT